MGYPDASMARGDGPASQAFDPLEMLESAADLANPVVAARQMPWLASELIKLATGQSGISFAEGDRRFADVTWQDNFFFRQFGRSYRLFEEWTDRMVDAVDGPWDRQARTRYLANVVTAMASPTNFFLTNPAALKRAFETGGMSALRGGRNMVRDLARGGMPQMVNREPFPVGEKLGCTPGAVVYRDEIFELLQYSPTTPAVRSRPLLMVPPELNRYYILDLAPGRSLVEYLVENGIQPFMIVWRNPQAKLGHGQWGLDDYLRAQAQAAEVVKKITRSDTINWLGLCAGGITTALMLGYLAATGDASAGSATFIVTMLTNRCPNIIGMMDTDESRKGLRRAAADGQVLPGQERAHQLRLAAPERPGVQLPRQRLAARPGPALVRRARVERRRHRDQREVRAGEHRTAGRCDGRPTAGHGARHAHRPREGGLRQLPHRRLHRPHHAVARRLHIDPGARRRQGDGRGQVRAHPVVRQPGGEEPV
jgi:polyhydroxyalkanoate synthase